MSPILTLREAARMLKIHPGTLCRLVNKRSIPAFKVGSYWRFNQEAIETWIRESTQVIDALDDP
jgi:excisionase family DNA binding protein